MSKRQRPEGASAGAGTGPASFVASCPNRWAGCPRQFFGDTEADARSSATHHANARRGCLFRRHGFEPASAASAPPPPLPAAHFAALPLPPLVVPLPSGTGADAGAGAGAAAGAGAGAAAGAGAGAHALAHAPPLPLPLVSPPLAPPPPVLPGGSGAGAGAHAHAHAAAGGGAGAHGAGAVEEAAIPPGAVLALDAGGNDGDGGLEPAPRAPVGGAKFDRARLCSPNSFATVCVPRREKVVLTAAERDTLVMYAHAVHFGHAQADFNGQIDIQNRMQGRSNENRLLKAAAAHKLLLRVMKMTGVEALQVLEVIKVRDNRRLGIHESELVVRGHSLRAALVGLVTNPLTCAPGHFFVHVDSPEVAAMLAAAPPHRRKLCEMYDAPEQQRYARAAKAFVEERPDFQDLKAQADAEGKLVVVVPVGVLAASDSAPMSKNCKVNLRPLNIQITNMSTTARQLKEAMTPLVFLESATMSVGRSHYGQKASESHASEEAKAEVHRLDHEVLRAAFCEQLKALDSEALIVLQARDMPGLADAWQKNDNLYIVLAPFFAAHIADLPEAMKILGLVQYTPLRHHRQSDYSNLGAKLVERSAKETNTLFIKLEAARARARDASVSDAVRNAADAEATATVAKLYASGVHAGEGRGRCAYSTHLPQSPTAGAAFVDRETTGYFGLFIYGPMHVQDLGVFKNLVTWVLFVITNQDLTASEKAVLPGRARRALFGARLGTVPNFSTGVHADRRSWKDGISQQFFSAKEIRAALHVLIAGIGFDSFVVASKELRTRIFEALECACNILFLQRRASLLASDVDECRAAYRRMAHVLSTTTFTTFKKSGLNYPKWLFGLLIFDEFERHGVPQGISEDANEKRFKLYNFVVHNNTNMRDVEDQVQRRVLEIEFCAVMLPEILGDSVPRDVAAFAAPELPTFGMRGRGAVLPPGITLQLVGKALVAYLSASGRLPEGFVFNGADVTLFKGAFLQRVCAEEPIDTSFYSSLFHGVYRRDIARLYQSVGSTVVLDQNPQTAPIVRLYLAFHYNCADLFDDDGAVGEAEPEDDDEVAAGASGALPDALVDGDMQSMHGLNHAWWAPRREAKAFEVIPLGQIGGKAHDRPFFKAKGPLPLSGDDYPGAAPGDAPARLISFRL